MLLVALSYLAITAGPALAKSAKVAKLESLLKDKYESVRIKSALALGKLGDRDAVPALISALKKDKSADVRAAVAVSLGNLKDPRAKDALTRAKSDKDAAVRSVAAGALAKLKPAGPAKLLKKSYYIEWGKVVNKSKVKDAELEKMYKDVFTKKLRKHSSDFYWSSKEAPAGLKMDGTIKKISKSKIDGMTAVEMSVSLVVKTVPGNALVTVADAEAGVALEGTVSVSEEKMLRKDALEAALDETFNLLVRALKVR